MRAMGRLISSKAEPAYIPNTSVAAPDGLPPWCNFRLVELTSRDRDTLEREARLPVPPGLYVIRVVPQVSSVCYQRTLFTTMGTDVA